MNILYSVMRLCIVYIIPIQRTFKPQYFFSLRLDQYGPGTEVPIKSLLGHRSQAPPEVRHV